MKSLYKITRKSDNMTYFIAAKNGHSAKYQAAKKTGGKPSDYWSEVMA